MKRIIYALLIAASVSGCAQLSQIYTTITTSQVDYRYAQLAIVAFNSLEKDGAVYLNLPTCVTNGPTICHDRNATLPIYASFKSGRIARNNLVAYMRNHPCSTTCPLIPKEQSVFSALQDAITTLQAVYSQYRVAVTVPQGA